MKYLVSGASGFIGRQLCRQLVSAGGVVTGISKSGGKTGIGTGGDSGRDSGSELELLTLDLATDTPDIEWLRGSDVVFHLAGIAHQDADDDAYEALNYQGTLRLARQAAAAGVRCFIFLSSVKAMGSPGTTERRGENDCTPPTDAYGLSKWRAECDLLEEFSDSPMSVVIIRPALVYGPHAKGNLRQLARAMSWLPRPPAGGARSMVALDDLVDLLCLLARDPPPGVHTWIACGKQDYSTRAIYDLLRQSAGKAPGTGWLPGWGWRLAASVLDVVTGKPAGSTSARLFGTEIYSSEAVQAATAWRPRTGLEDMAAQLLRGCGENR